MTSRNRRFMQTLTLIVATCAALSARAFEPAESKMMRVGTPAQELYVNLDGVETLYLYADFGGDSYDCDQAVWANPTLVAADGKTLDLTTVKPDSAKTGWGSLLINQNHVKEKLNIAGKTFDSGFWAHGPSLLSFDLKKIPGDWKKFTVFVGLDRHAERGSVVFHILDKPVEYPDSFDYDPIKPKMKYPPVPRSTESELTFDKEGAQKLLDEGIDQLVFVRRYTYNSNHIYTDHVNSDWLPGAGFCVLDLKTGKTRDLLFDELHNGMIQRFDISYDGKKILFDFRASPMEGYRIYEANLDGTGLRQLTFPVEEERALAKKYRRGLYMHGTDDLHPCYLPDGGIVFVSTRPQFSVLCDASDNFTVTNLYRMDGDGKNMQPLTFSALNEWSPAVLPDGRIIYHRWEYVDKAAGNAKALWAINPDGTGPSEIYGDNISFPETMIYPRPIPGSDNKIVFLGASHCCPNNAFGSVIVIDAKDNARSIDTMHYITDDVRAYHHNGFHFRDENGEYKHDMTGKPGRLFKDPYPISEELFIASRKPAGLVWSEPTGYDLVLLDENGEETPLLADKNASCWHPVPLIERELPPVRSSAVDPELAKKNLALCAITNIYSGMEGVEPGAVKYVRVLEQIPRSWSARKSWGDDHEGTTHAHSAVANGSLSVKVQLGIAPVEEDGSACFYVPADRAIYFQALDDQYRALQTERTYVNYRPGERRSCVGCHETQSDAPLATNPVTPAAMLRAPSVLQPQPGQETAEIAFDYDRQIQPVWDRNCVSCHDGGEKAPTPDLRGNPQGVYSVSYWNLVNLGNNKDHLLLGGRETRNEDAASNGIEFLDPYETCSPSSPLAAWLFGETSLKKAPEAAQNKLELLIYVHKDADVKLTKEEKVLLANWLDVNAPYHPSYFGRLHEKFRDRLDYRPEITPEEARSRTLPERIKKLYEDADRAVKK